MAIERYRARRREQRRSLRRNGLCVECKAPTAGCRCERCRAKQMSDYYQRKEQAR